MTNMKVTNNARTNRSFNPFEALKVSQNKRENKEQILIKLKLSSNLQREIICTNHWAQQPKGDTKFSTKDIPDINHAHKHIMRLN